MRNRGLLCMSQVCMDVVCVESQQFVVESVYRDVCEQSMAERCGGIPSLLKARDSIKIPCLRPGT